MATTKDSGDEEPFDQLMLKVVGGRVEVTLDCAHQRIISNVYRAAPVRVKAPLLKRDRIYALTAAEAASSGTDQRCELDALIGNRSKAIETEVLEIRKSMKRIASYMHAINVAIEIKEPYSEFD